MSQRRSTPTLHDAGTLGDLVAVLILGSVWAVVVALVGLGGDYALNDDWVYAYSAKHLLHTGQLRLLDWGAPSLASHAVWGAGIMAVLGESFVTLRVGTLVWALVAIECAYGLARCLLPVRAALVVALGLGLSPWFLNLSFTYMTDVPWLAMMFAAALALARAFDPRGRAAPRPPLLLLSGVLLGVAALTRQFAVIVAPTFALVVALDARRRLGARWFRPALVSCLLLAVPAALLFLPYQAWYSAVHGATLANRETVTRMMSVRPWHVGMHLICVAAYFGLWLSPLSLLLALSGRPAELLRRRAAIVTLVVLGIYAVARPLADPHWIENLAHPGDLNHPLMPYLGNVFTLSGIGPPTVTDVYWGDAPVPHAALFFGIALTLVSILGLALATSLVPTIRSRLARAWAPLEGPDPGPFDNHRSSMVRALLVTSSAAYLIFQVTSSTFVIDRYVLPLLVPVLILAVDALPPEAARPRVVTASLAACAMLSISGTQEYLSWNAARDQAVRDLVASGVPAGDIDGGFEWNGPHHFEAFVARTGKLVEVGSFWMKDAPFRISFWPAHSPDCVTGARYPYWTWPGGGDRAVYVHRCGASREK